ncbi:MAG: hypothetical protein MUP11_13675 [Anaerolineales bacterium]|nr:hypothetical protein [Anaerolineales bacterium]
MKSKIWVIIILISILISACDKPVRATLPPGPNQTWIDAPLDGSTLPLLPYKLVFHGASFVGVTEFEVQVDSVVMATVPPISSGSGGQQYGTMFLGEYEWTPPAPGIYLITVRAKGNGQFSSPDQVQITVSGGELKIISPMPMELVQECIYTALINQFCRLSSGIGYEAVDNFVAGQSAPIIGQSTDDFFWYVYGPNYGELCTVPKAERFGETDGDCAEQPRFTPIPLPSPTPTLEPTPCPAGVPCP